MPAKDKYHDAVVRALVKDGWTILKEQYRLVAHKRRLWIDIRAARQQSSELIFVEVKSFENVLSQIVHLQFVIGQYLLYRAIIVDTERNEKLYLAIPKHAYEGVFSEYIGQLAIRYFNLKIIVFNIEQEAIVQWIN